MIHKLCITASALALLTSCQTTTDFGVHAVQPSDIHVPRGMVLDTHLHRSNSVEVGEYRHANLVYRGSTPTMEIGAYLKNRLPQHSYQLKSQERTDDSTEQFVFERGPYVVTCTVRRLERQSELDIKLRTNPKL